MSEQKNAFALPMRRARIKGTLTLHQHNNDLGPVMALGERTATGRTTWLLKDGDRILTPTGDVQIEYRQTPQAYLNNRLGTLIEFTPCAHFPMERRRLELMEGLKTFYFLGRCPMADKEDLLLLMDACFFERTVTLAPAAQPLAQPDARFLTGHLLPHYETGMEGIAPILHTQMPVGEDTYYLIRPGDSLRVLNFDGTSTIWSGEVSAQLLDQLRESFKTPGFRLPGYENMPPEIYHLNEYFSKGRPAVLKKANR